MVNTEKRKILVVGAGISGITAAYVLSQRHHVTLLERNDYVGGHTNTRIVPDPINPQLPVDTGFIVCNPQNYPNFYQFLRQLGVKLQPSDMSFGFSCERSGLQYMGPSVKEFLQAPGNLFSLKFVGMILDQRRFNQRVLRDMEAGRLDNIPLSAYLREIGISDFFVENYLTPLIGSIWSAPDARTLDFPALTFATFFKNHGMLELNKRPQWQTVVGGSHAYVKAFRERFSGVLRSSSEVRGISRENGSVVVHRDGAEPERFDAVVIATHADEALKLLADPSESEVAALGAWSYSTNRTVLHTDASVLAPSRRLWAAWNYRRTITSRADSPVAITYYMNKLQNLVAQRDYFVTLNCTENIDPQKVLYEVAYTHPMYTPDSPESQRRLRALNGERNTYFCGAYMRYGFHEDGVMSALDVAAKFGLSLRDTEPASAGAPQRVVDMAV